MSADMNWVTFLLIITLLPPQAGVEVELVVYRPGWIEQSAGRCITDAGGVCQIRGSVSSWEDGLVRGMLRVAGRERPLIWPGGGITIRWDGETAGELRYDSLPQDASAAPRIQERGNSPALLVMAALLLMGSALYWQGNRPRRIE